MMSPATAPLPTMGANALVMIPPDLFNSSLGRTSHSSRADDVRVPPIEPPRSVLTFPDVRETPFHRLAGHQSNAGSIIASNNGLETHNSNEVVVDADSFDHAVECRKIDNATANECIEIGLAAYNNAIVRRVHREMFRPKLTQGISVSRQGGDPFLIIARTDCLLERWVCLRRERQGCRRSKSGDRNPTCPRHEILLESRAHRKCTSA